jgi:hypothetical protein
MPTISNLALATLAVGVLVIFWKWTHSHPNFDLSDIVTGNNGRVSSTKLLKVGAWVLSSWGFVTLIQQGNMTEWYFAGYMGLSFGVAVARDITGKKEPTP